MPKKNIFLLAILAFSIPGYSQPEGYYSEAEGKSGEELQQALHDIVDDHTVKSYSYLWEAFKTTDKNAEGTVWDMYSDVPGGSPPYTYTFVTDQCGNYSGEGSCYNREHSFPKSWFDDASPMYTDLFHLYPTDGYVNGKRSNYPFGETSSPTWTSQNGSKVGPCSVNGYTGTIFEPIDEYKGDFARTYFYMAVRYYGEDGSWPGSPMVDGSQPKPWAREMLLRWHVNDPVSEKETERNNAVYLIQDNRNPFIDHPEYVSRLYNIGNFDEIAPVVDSVTLQSSSLLKIWFNEVLDPESASDASHYTISGGIAVQGVNAFSNDSLSVELSVDGLQNGDYTLTVNGVSDTTGNVMNLAFYSFSITSLILGLYEKTEIKISPNPGNGQFIIDIPGYITATDLLSVYDISGRKIPFEFQATATGILMDITTKAGIYVLNYINCDGFSTSTRFMVY